MLGNDQHGDCVEAAYAHQLQIWMDRASNSQSAYDPTAADVLAAYSAMTGFNPNIPGSDRGSDMLAACNYWRGTGLNGYTVDAFLQVTPTDHVHVQECIAWYASLYVGFQLPVSAEHQFPGTWEVRVGPDSQPGSWGGHCVPVSGYDQTGVYVVTWGKIQAVTWEFFDTYADEAYVFLAHEWISQAGLSPSGLAWGMLQADLANL